MPDDFFVLCADYRLAPTAGREPNPLMPSSSKRFTQLLTVVWCISKCPPIWGELKPCAFNSTALHRIRKACDEPLRYPSSNADCCIGLNLISLILPIWNVFSFMGITDFWHKYYHPNYFCGYLLGSIDGWKNGQKNGRWIYLDHAKLSGIIFKDGVIVDTFAITVEDYTGY